MDLKDILIMNILRYIMNTFQFMNKEFRDNELWKYYDKNYPSHNLEDLEVNKFKFFTYYTSNYDLTKIYQLSNEDKSNLNLEFLFIKNNHNLKFFNYNIFFNEVFNSSLNLTYLVYSIVEFDKISSFIIFKSNEDYLEVKSYLKDLNNNLTIKNFLKLDKIEDKSLFFNKKDLELLDLIEDYKFKSFNSKSIEDLEVELKLIEDLLYLIDLKIDLFKSIMINNSIKINKTIKLSKSYFKLSNFKKVTYSYLSKSNNHLDLELVTKFYLNEKDLEVLEKDLKVLNLLISKYDYYLELKEDLEDKIEDLEVKEDLFKFSSLLNLNEDNLEDYDNFNYYSYYKNF